MVYVPRRSVRINIYTHNGDVGDGVVELDPRGKELNYPAPAAVWARVRAEDDKNIYSAHEWCRGGGGGRGAGETGRARGNRGYKPDIRGVVGCRFLYSVFFFFIILLSFCWSRRSGTYTIRRFFFFLTANFRKQYRTYYYRRYPLRV